MDLILLVLVSGLDSVCPRLMDAGIPPVFIAVGFIVIVLICLAIVGIIVAATKLLKRFRDNKTNNDRLP